MTPKTSFIAVMLADNETRTERTGCYAIDVPPAINAELARCNELLGSVRINTNDGRYRLVSTDDTVTLALYRYVRE